MPAPRVAVTTPHGTARAHNLVLWLLMATQALTLSWCAVRNTFTWTEVGLLPSGIVDWNYGGFGLYRVNPPLLRMWSTIPLMFVDADVPFDGIPVDPRERGEWQVARSMIDKHGATSLVWLSVARLMCLPFCLLGTWVAHRWASELFGWQAGLGAAALLVTSPLMIGHGHVMGGDGQAASMGLVTLYVFRQWLGNVSWPRSYLLGVCAGVAVLTKTSWLALFGLLPLLWLIVRAGEFLIRRSPASDQRSRLVAVAREVGLAVFAFAVCLLIINLLYGGKGTLKPLREYRFISKALAGSEGWKAERFHGNRFGDRWLGRLPVPLPEDLVIGIDLQKWDFDRERWSYFRGEWKTSGWWYYYLYGLFIKTPLATWLLVVMAFAGAVAWRHWREPWQDFVILAVPVSLVLFAASAETGLNRHVRYVLPVIPMGMVLVSRVFQVFAQSRTWDKRCVAAAMTWISLSSLWIYPHSHSYFNEVIGGPLQGHRHMNASNLDWGQDLRFLCDWCDRNPECRPIAVRSYLHLINPKRIGIPSEGRVPSLRSEEAVSIDEVPKRRFHPGWYAIDLENILRRFGDYRYLEEFQPVAHAGYGFRIYRITPELADDLERRYREGVLE